MKDLLYTLHYITLQKYNWDKMGAPCVFTEEETDVQFFLKRHFQYDNECKLHMLSDVNCLIC